METLLSMKKIQNTTCRLLSSFSTSMNMLLRCVLLAASLKVDKPKSAEQDEADM